jgi:hypothetical protein
MACYTEISIGLSLNGALTNIVADRFDAGVRLVAVESAVFRLSFLLP